MAKKRERLEVIYDILVSIRNNHNSIKPTRLLYSSNLSPQMFKEYVTELQNKEFITKEELKKNKSFFSVTTKGFKFIERYEIFIDFVDNIGL